MLYIISTPIGNIEDTSFRAVKTLCNTDIILCEDTRSFSTYFKRIKDLFHLNPAGQSPLGGAQSILSFHKQNEFQRIPGIIEDLKSGKDIALVSESGTPAISDPGHLLIKEVIKNGLPLTSIPGPTAFVSAAVLSGFPTDKILFLGFLPKKQSQVIQLFKQLHINISKYIDLTIIFYESPHRINKTLKIISDVLPKAEVVVAREMTKRYEQLLLGRAKAVKDKKFKGELTVTLYINQN